MIWGDFWGGFLIIMGDSPFSYYFYIPTAPKAFFISFFLFFLFFLTYYGANFMRQGWRLRSIMWGKKNFLFYHIYYISLIPSLGQMAFNAQAVTDVWGR
jgi:hypothetical protein